MTGHIILICLLTLDCALLFVSIGCFFKYLYMKTEPGKVHADLIVALYAVLVTGIAYSAVTVMPKAYVVDACLRVGALTLPLGAAVYLSALSKRKMKQSVLSQRSLKIGLDSMHYGVGIFDVGGRPKLVNRQLDELSTALAGKNIVNQSEFWNTVSSESLPSGCTRLIQGDEPVLKLENGEIWSFSRQKLRIDGKDVYQITAADTTEIFNLKTDLIAGNEQREELNRRIKDYGESVDAYTRSKEVLDAKMKIHDDLGSILTAAHRCLMGEADRETTLAMWKRTYAGLKGAFTEDPGVDSLDTLIKAAKDIGVNVRITGNRPTPKSAAAELLELAVHECVTNAVRHAGGDVLYVTCFKSPGFSFECRNNGRPPEGEIRESGGLSNLRKRVEAMHGTMQIESQPYFRLNISLPEENDG